MVNQAIVEVDRRVSVILGHNPNLGPTGAMSLVFAADPHLYRDYKREMSAIGAALGGATAQLTEVERSGSIGREVKATNGQRHPRQHSHD